MMTRLIACCILLTVVVSPLLSQSLRVIATRDGLPQSFVSGLVQDDSSFMWIGTRNGIARFDGIGFKAFQPVPDDSSSISTDLVIWLEKDAHNRIWIEHETGEIDGLDPVTERVTHLLTGNLRGGAGVRFARRGWLVDHKGSFWAITRDIVNRFNPRTGQIKRFDWPAIHATGDTVRGLIETSQHELWVVSQRSIGLFDSSTGDFRHFAIPYVQDFGVGEVSGSVAIGVHERKNGELMWGDRNTLYFFNPGSRAFRMSSLPKRSFHGIDWIRNGPDQFEYFENGGRMYRYDDSMGVSSIAGIVPGDFGIVESFFVDRSGLLWVGTDGAGIKQVDLTTPYFKSYAYKINFGVDIMKELFGIDLFRQFDLPSQADEGLSPGYQLRWAYDHHRRLYLALKGSVCYFDSLQKNWVRMPKLPKEMGIAGISFLKDERPVVITTAGNVLAYDMHRQLWEEKFSGSQIRRQSSESVSPEDIYADDQFLWITTISHGLLRVDQHSGQVTQLLKPDAAKGGHPVELVKLCPDPRQRDILWIGSYAGLIRLDTKTLAVTRLSLKEGLPDNVVYSLAADRSGDLWFGTNKGLCQLDQVSGHIRVFTTQHGLPGDEHNRFHFMVLPDGQLVFGGVDGWTVFDPLTMKKDAFEPPVALTGLKVNNSDIVPAPDGKGILKLPLNTTTRIDLPYDQNTIAFGFAGLEFSQPQEIGYRYRLSGYENDWVPAGASRQAVYTKLPPGDYIFQVNASNTSGVWSTNVKSIIVHVRAPWWLTIPARIIYILLVIGLTLFIIYIRDRRMEMRREMEWKEKERLRLKELDDLKTRFFSNITHEFRTPLTLIMAPAERLQHLYPTDAEAQKLAGIIEKNANQLLTLVNRLLDLTRLDGHAFPMTEKRGSPAVLVGGLMSTFELEAVGRGISLTLRDDTQAEECLYYPDALERIVYNLVSNALKFTSTGGKIDIILSMTPEMLRLEVEDNGIGIPPEELKHIFDRFYQAGHRGGQGLPEEVGSGIGLAMVKEIIGLIKGTIAVDSVEGQGTRFSVSMPVRKYAVAAIDTQHEIAGDDLRTRPTILLIEDNPEMAGFIRDVLAREYDIVQAFNGAEGLDQALIHMPDLVICDVMMPVMDGHAFCVRLRDDIRTSHIPVVLLTARTTHQDVLEGLGHGATDYLIKPFHPEELLLRVHNLLDRLRKWGERVKREMSSPADDHPLKDGFLQRLYEQLDQHLDDPEFGVDQLVTVMNISRSGLHRKLKSITGLTTTEVVRIYRLKKAAELLRQGLNSQEAAYKTGFGTPAYFSKCFREMYGQTPSEYSRKYYNRPS